MNNKRLLKEAFPPPKGLDRLRNRVLLVVTVVSYFVGLIVLTTIVGWASPAAPGVFIGGIFGWFFIAIGINCLWALLTWMIRGEATWLSEEFDIL